MIEFEPFPKIARLKRELVITEKVDGTNAQVHIVMPTTLEPYDPTDTNVIAVLPSDGVTPPLVMYAGSRKRYIVPEGTIEGKKGTDNFGFARWVRDNNADLFKLGEGRHYGEWYGQGIQRGYGLNEKRFALFNVARWGDESTERPECCDVVRRIADADGDFDNAEDALEFLGDHGSFSAPGFMDPEGIVVWHSAARTLFKMTFGMDGKWKEKVNGR